MEAHIDPWSSATVARLREVYHEAKAHNHADGGATARAIARVDAGPAFWIQLRACFEVLQSCVLIQHGSTTITKQNGLDFVLPTQGGEACVWLQRFAFNSCKMIIPRIAHARKLHKPVVQVRFACDGTSCSK